MNKKSLLMMMLTICLIAVVGVGSTLAYLSAKTDVMTNTFTVGNVTVVQDETDITGESETGRTNSGNTYANILPGMELTKDPTATVKEGSAKCYVFMKLEGADALGDDFAFAFDANNEISPAWNKVTAGTGLDGVYQYEAVVDASNGDVVLPSLFKTVTYSIDATEFVSDNGINVTIQTCAIQADYMDGKDVVAEAKGLFANNNQ